MMKKVCIGLASLFILSSIGGIFVDARQIGQFSNFEVTYSGGERYTSYLIKQTSKNTAVVNLSNDSGSAWIAARMVNSENKARGYLEVQRGKRGVMTTSGAKPGYSYRLGLKKARNTGGGRVVIKGSWSPDQ